MDASGLLFGSKVRAVVAVVAGIVLVVGGSFFAGLLGVPTVERIDNRFGDVNETDTAIETDLVVHNPNPIEIRLGDLSVNYTVSMNDVEMARGDKHGVAIGTGNSTVNLTTHLQNDRIPEWWVSHIRNDEQTDLAVSATVQSGTVGRSTTLQPAARSIETDVISQFNSSEDRPVNADAPVVSDPVLVIRETNASWGTVTDEETPIDIEFDAYNPKTSPVVVSNVGYNISMNDVQVGQGETDDTVTIPGRTSRVVATPTVVDNEDLDDWWVTHVENNQRTELRIDFYAEVEPPATDETVRVPLDDMTYTKTIETDMFGTKGESSGETDGSDESDTATTEGDDSTTGDETTTGEDTMTEEGTGDDTTTDDSTTEADGTTTDDGSTTTGDDSTTDDGILVRDPVVHA